MPFDSSKVEFHDKMDMFYKLNYLKRPIEDQAHYELMQKTKKEPKEEKKTRDEILFEQNEVRKQNIMYLQRLESQGA